MSLSESELEQNFDDDDLEEDMFNSDMGEDMFNSDMGEDTFNSDMEEDIFDNDEYDNACDFEDTKRFASLLDSLLEKAVPDLLTGPSVDVPPKYPVRLAMALDSDSSTNLNLSSPYLNDSLHTYLTVSPIIQKPSNSSEPYLSIDPTADSSGSNSLSSPELFVANLPSYTNLSALKEWFIGCGYGVSRIDAPNNRRACYAFVRFDSISIATKVLYKSEQRRSNFVFNGQELDIKRPTRSSTRATYTVPMTTATDGIPKTFKFNIIDIQYGTLIIGAAMENIHKRNSTVSNHNEFGIIVQGLMNEEGNISFRLNIDPEKKKLSIIGEIDLKTSIFSSGNIALGFEWNFQDLKGRKVTPVLVNHKDIFLLIEFKRPPIVLKVRNITQGSLDTSDDSRLPAPGFTGHANTWLFKLSSENLDNSYVELFTILRRYNLSQKQFSEHNIISLISSLEVAEKNLECVQVLQNDLWVKQNQAKIDDFLCRRWPSYPFETKFEIMKLISKHIIRVYDLIVDEQAENILKKCTINTLIACTDRIAEFAPRWFATTCDNVDEDWSMKTEEQTEFEPTIVDNSLTSSHIRLSTTGASIDVENTETASMMTDMNQLSSGTQQCHIGTFSRLLLFALDELHKKNELRQITGVYATKLELRTANANAFLIRKVYITPSTILYEGPYREEKCAVTREFVNHQDRFLRVTFRDEDYRELHNYNNNMTKMYERIKKILINGISICGRNYQFLAFSSSQLREHSCWMFASIKNGTTVDTIRAWMGDFQNVRPVAKLAARLGQSFSTSIKGIKLENKQFKEIPDVTTNDINSPKVFTDGIGIIAPKFAKKLAEEMKLSCKIFYPSAFQIRCGGYKGMVCIDVTNHISNPNINVSFRPSMKKFSASNFSVDVIRTSLNPSTAYLNRQIILLLSSLGISNDIFIFLQDIMLEQLKALTGEPKKACEALKALNEFGGNGYHTFLIEYLKIMNKQKEPFTRQILLVFQTFFLKELRTKAKIQVPNSWNLLGVIDETRTLKYGQVFIQIDNSNQQQEGITKQILQGPVIVTRNPCFHPGDIRRLEAIDVPALHELKNVIVFPMDGPRPHPMEMSGGDLDGDTFWVCHHSDLIFQTNEEPFDYHDQTIEAQSLANVQHTIDDVCNFFGEYIAADNLGIIANSHLAFADRLTGGAKNEKCLQLGKMHSIAVDFAKNGISAPRLTRDLRLQEYPHYMEKKDKTTYHSETILGTSQTLHI